MYMHIFLTLHILQNILEAAPMWLHNCEARGLSQRKHRQVQQLSHHTAVKHQKEQCHPQVLETV